ncbi:MAG: hypothetical protein QM657_15615 [Lacrimispora sp.]|uniref:hypothetical protein n=1 Tax=Lacrimispora sp. TaxID=2719234 RepID=UPI0039E536A6
MDDNQNPMIKSASEIGYLAGKLSPNNQSYVLNTINALLFSQYVNKNREDKKEIKK